MEFFEEFCLFVCLFPLPKPRASLIAQLVKNLPAMQFDSWVGKIHWERDRLPTPVFLGFTCGSASEESTCNAGDLGLIPGLGKGLCRWHSGKESTCQCRKLRFDPWVGTIPQRRKWQPTPVFLPGKFHRQRSLAGYSAWGHTESDTAEHACTALDAGR